MKGKRINGLTRVTALALCALAAVTLTGCINDDAGDVAFVKQVVPAVLGRRVHNVAELEVLTELAGSGGRQAVVDLLMDQAATAAILVGEIHALHTPRPKPMTYRPLRLSASLSTRTASSSITFSVQRDSTFPI